MSAGVLAATLAVAFVGGSLGAIVGAAISPWLTYRFGRNTRLAELREKPYEAILQAARAVQEASVMLTWVRDVGGTPVTSFLDQFETARTTLEEHRRSARFEQVMSPTMRSMVDHLGAVALEVTGLPLYRREGDRIVEVPPRERTEAFLELHRAYERLRDQVQRETRG